MFSLIVLFLLFGTSLSTDVVVKDLRLYVDGQEFFIKAMCYQPSPLGLANMDENGNLGGGYCSPKRTPFGEWKSACFDSDYFDGSPDIPTRWPPGPPSGGWFDALWDRDFPLLRELGVNTIRIYNSNPTTRQASVYYPGVVPEPVGKNHVPFFDKAHSFGFKVIFPLVGDYTLLMTTPVEEFKRWLRWQIDEVGNHPALLMWGFSNELDISGNQALVDLMNEYIGYIKQYTSAKWGRTIPVTTAVVDLPESYNWLAENLNVDIFTTNAGYRGYDFSDLWDGNTEFSGWHHLSCRYNKPVFIGEIGWHSLNNQITYDSPDWVNQIWKDLILHIDQGCIGGAFFEYSDEPMKADPLQQTMGVVRFDVSTVDGVMSTDSHAWNPDTVVRKDIIFAALANGTAPDGVAYNMNSDPFRLIGRDPYLLSDTNTPSICSSFTLTQCPVSADDGTPFGGMMCSWRGQCDLSVGTCSCPAGWGGEDCSVAECPGSCSGQGTCVASLVSPPACDCEVGWGSSDCSVQLSGACPNNCTSGNGACQNGQCVCVGGWYGFDCSFPDITYPSDTSSSTTGQPGSTTGSDSGSTGSGSGTTGSGSGTTGSDSGSTGSTGSDSGTTGSDSGSTTESASTSGSQDTSSTSDSGSTGSGQSTGQGAITSAGASFVKANFLAVQFSVVALIALLLAL